MRAETAEPIEVAPFDDAPAQFLLRGRLHVVRAVLASWREPGGWRWSGPREVVAVPVAVPVAAGMGAGVGAREPAPLPCIPSVPVDLGDKHLWRVEAAAGMSDRPRVFDLCRDPERTRWTATLVEE